MSSPSSVVQLSSGQRSVWFDQLLFEDDLHYNIGEYLELTGDIDIDALMGAIAATVAQTSSLRLVARERDLEPEFELLTDVPVDIAVVDLRGGQAPLEMASRWMEAALRRPFQLEGGLLFRFAVLRLADSVTLLFMAFHHLIMDGYGMSLLAERIAHHYQRAASPSLVPPGPDTRLLLDYLDTDRAYQGSTDQRADGQFWQEMHHDVRSRRNGDATGLRSNSPLRRARVDLQTPDLAEIQDFCRREDLDFPSLLLTIAIQLLAPDHDAVPVALPFHGRTPYRFRRLASMCTNILPLRLHAPCGLPLGTLTRSISDQLQPALQHHRYRDLGADLRRVGGPAELYRSSVNIMTFGPTASVGTLSVRRHCLPCGEVPAELGLKFYDRGGEEPLEIYFDVDSARPDGPDPQVWAASFQRLMAQLGLPAPTAAQLGRTPDRT